MESRQVSKDVLRELILSGGLDDEVIYKVDGSLLISDTGDLETLSGNISVAGALIIRDCPNLNNLSTKRDTHILSQNIYGCLIFFWSA